MFIDINYHCEISAYHITTKVVILIPAHDEVYSLQRNMIKFASDFPHVGGFFQVLKLAFNTMILTLTPKIPHMVRCTRYIFMC